MDQAITPPIINLLRSIDCPHDAGGHQKVSELVIYRTATGSDPDYQIVRTVFVCTVCGLPAEVRDVQHESPHPRFTS